MIKPELALKALPFPIAAYDSTSNSAPEIVTAPEPFVVNVIPTSESPPVALKIGLFPLAAVVILK